jgi:mannose-6-phosphate isomerase-like protein (cupin superfamily)/DNA-binding CsgD family transcriptional regulator
MTAFRKAVISTPGKERIMRTPFGDRIVIHATAQETNGAYGMWETFPEPGKGPALHTHTRETECFRVVRGTYRFRCGEDEFDVSAGAVVVLPPHVPHSFRNIGEAPGQMFVVVTPGGFEQFFCEIEAAHREEVWCHFDGGARVVQPQYESIHQGMGKLARASFVAAHMPLEGARAATQALALLGIPALVFADNGNVLAANQLIDTLRGFILWRANDRIALKDARADALLRDAIATGYQDDSPSVRSFPVRHADSIMIAHVVPIRGAARDVFFRCAAMLMLTPVTRPEAPSVDLIRSLFDLTPAEARVARGLAAGQTVKGIAAESGTSTNTVRSHVKVVLTKVGYSRQSDVVALLNGLRSPGSANGA